MNAEKKMAWSTLSALVPCAKASPVNVKSWISCFLYRLSCKIRVFNFIPLCTVFVSKYTTKVNSCSVFTTQVFLIPFCTFTLSSSVWLARIFFYELHSQTLVKTLKSWFHSHSPLIFSNKLSGCLLWFFFFYISNTEANAVLMTHHVLYDLDDLAEGDILLQVIL